MSLALSLTALIAVSRVITEVRSQVSTEYLYPASCFEHATTTGLDIVTITDIVYSTRYHHVICPVCTGMPELYHNGVPKDTPVYETIYTCPGPHGMEAKTYTITEPCPTTGLSRPTDYIPSGFHVTEAQCTGCPGSPYVHVTTPAPQETHKPGRLPPPPPGSNAPPKEYHIPSQEEDEHVESGGAHEQGNNEQGKDHSTPTENGGSEGASGHEGNNGNNGGSEGATKGPGSGNGSGQEHKSTGQGEASPGGEGESQAQGHGQSSPGEGGKEGPGGHGQANGGGSGEAGAGPAGKGGNAGQGHAAPSGTAAAGGKNGPETFKGSAQRGLELQWAIAIVAMTFALFMI